MILFFGILTFPKSPVPISEASITPDYI